MERVSDEHQLVSIDVLDEEGLDRAAALQPVGIEDEDGVPDRTLTGFNRCRIGETLDLFVVTALATVGDDHQVDIGPQIGIGLLDHSITASARAIKPNRPQILRQLVLKRADQALDNMTLRIGKRSG